MTDVTQSPNAKIDPSLSGFTTPVGELRTHPDNARQGDVNAIAESLTRFGQLRPAVALPDGTIVAGNHMFRAATEVLGWTHIAAIRVDLTDTEAAAYLLADNRTAELGTMDPEALAKLLDRIGVANLAGTGYTADDVDDLAAELAALDEEELPYRPPTNTHAEGGNPAAAATGDGTAPAAPRQAMEQFILLYGPDTAEQFRADIKALQTAWGVNGVREVALEAVKRAADAERAA